jgi:hypothetical protein
MRGARYPQARTAGARRISRSLMACILLGGLARIAAGAGPAAAGGMVITGGEDLGEPPPLAVRVTWGGGRPRHWTGSIGVEVVEDRAKDQAPLPPRGRFEQLRTLATDEAANGSFHIDRGRILLHAPVARTFDGIEMILHEWSGASLTIELRPDNAAEDAVKRFSVPLGDVLTARLQEPLDDEGNRLIVTRAPGDDIRIRFPAHAGERCPTLRAPGEPLQLLVQPVIASAATRGEHSLRARLVDPTTAGSLFEADIPVGRPGKGPGGLAALREVPLVVPMPSRAGGYEIQFSVAEAGSLRWNRPVATRSVAVAVMDRAPKPAVSQTEQPGELLYELDPGSPRLIERLRRLPGMSGVPSVSIPAVSAMSKLPSGGFGLGQRTGSDGLRFAGSRGGFDGGLLSAVRGLDSLIPRGGGLLAHGFSSLETHSLGPVLRLPPAAGSADPTWEAVAIPAAVPGRPHVLEIEYPSDQRATLAVAVLEPDPAGGFLPPARSGGFRVEPLPLAPQPPGIRTYLLPFWPSTRSPVVVMANPSTTTAAMIGKLRVRSGEAALSLTDRDETPSRRSVRGVLLEPSFQALGIGGATDPQTGQTVQSWSGLIAGADRLADLLAARRAGGALVTVYADGAACWPTDATLGSPRWDGGAFTAGGPDPVRKDLVTVLCRAFDRRSLELVPGIDCSGPIAELEEIVARGGPLAMGIECTGPDGAPLPPAAGVRRYNPLDPRVQEAVVRLADDLAAHVAGRTAVQSIAIVASAEGWLHLPGVASCLDDATVARFARESGIEMPAAGADRFAERAQLVEGAVREAWLAWRARRLAAFYRRIAEVVAVRDGTLDLHVVATDVPDAPRADAARGAADTGARGQTASFPGDLGDETDHDPTGSQRLLEAGIAPALIASHPRIVFVAPHVSGDPLDLAGLATAERTRGAVAAAVRETSGTRLGCIATARPVRIELAGIVRHLGGAGRPSGPTDAPFEAVATGPTANRPLAESLTLGDLECFYDGTLLSGLDAESIDGAADFAALPAGRLERVKDAPEPLVVRSANDGRSTWIVLVNPAPVACSVRIVAAGCVPPRIAGPSADDGARGGLPEGDGSWTVSLRPWETRVVRADGAGAITRCEVFFEPEVERRMELSLASLTRRRSALETPSPLEGLDNPSFELPWAGETLPGWELVDPDRGRLGEAEGSEGGRALSFSSETDVASLRSNPFATPATGRVSVAAKLRFPGTGPAPPVRIAVEGTLDGSPYYRYAEVGGLAAAAGGTSRPSGPRDAAEDRWRAVVLQIDDLPPQRLDSLRVRFDLLGAGEVVIDDVRIYGLAFEETQRIQLAKLLAAIAQHVRDGGIGTAARELDGYWPRFLEAFVPDQPPEVAVETAPEPQAEPERRAGVMDRLRRWWR